MKKIITFCLFITAISACADNTMHEEQFKREAALKIKSLATNLKKELSESMQSGGPIAAVNTCKLKAPEIAYALNDEVTIKRTSLKLRNPNNVPDEWEKQILLSFEEKLTNGIPATELIHSETFDNNNSTTFRMMRAIPTQGLCLTCHGDKQTMSKDLVTRLDEAYPDDLATGYQAGQIRGAFSVTKTIQH